MLYIVLQEVPSRARRRWLPSTRYCDNFTMQYQSYCAIDYNYNKIDT